VGALFTTVLI